MPLVPIHEKRWNEASGIRYMSDGLTHRCQGISKTRLRRARIEQNKEDPKLYPSDDFWPECQCGKPAMMTPGAGLYACKFHGGAPAFFVPLYQTFLFLKSRAA